MTERIIKVFFPIIGRIKPVNGLAKNIKKVHMTAIIPSLRVI